MLLEKFASFIALSSTAFAIPSSRENGMFKRSVRENLTSPPTGWVKDDSVEVAKETSMMSLRIHLVHQDMNKFHELVMNVRITVSLPFVKPDKV